MANSGDLNVENSMKNICNIFQSFLENIQLVIDQLKEGESRREVTEDFTLDGYWTKLGLTVKGISTECTKLCMAFSQPPLPSPKDTQGLITRLEAVTLAAVSAFYGLPKSQGITLRRNTLHAMIGLMTSVHAFGSVIMNYGCQGSKDQLQSTGGVWECCDRFPSLPKDNKEAVLKVCRDAVGLVRDALEEIEEAQKNENDGHHWDDFDVALQCEDHDLDMDQGPCWTEEDRKLLSPALGLVKASRACVKKVTTAIKSNGQCDLEENIFQLDDLCDRLKEVSPAVDELVSCLYPPVRHSLVLQHAEKLTSVLGQLLENAKHTHVTTEEDSSWVQFLDTALQHNISKLRESVPGNS